MRAIMRWLVYGGFIVVFATLTTAQMPQKKGKYDPPAQLAPNEQTLKQIEARTDILAAKIAELRKDKKHPELLPDVEIFWRAAVNIVRFKEFYHKDSVKWTFECLDRGIERAGQLAKGDTPWTKLEKRNVLRAYRSQIDGTAQPYGVTYPLDYGKDPKRKWRVDVVLHGRNATLTEVAFLKTHNGSKKVPADQDWVQIDIFGRGNNAYRWAGETDVLEVMRSLSHAEMDHLDSRRFVLRGFSMGGAGTWHLGLRHPGLWCVMGPGAGFTTTHGYASGLPAELPDYQERCLRIYDAIDYAENARTVPIVAYSGGEDPQKLAADNIEKRLKELKIDAMTHLVAPGLGHKMPDDWFKKANQLWSKHSANRFPLKPEKFSFVTYTTKAWNGGCVHVLALERHYERAIVEGEPGHEVFRLTTKNVRQFKLTGMWVGRDTIVEIDGQRVECPFFDAYFAKLQGKWKSMMRDEFFKHESSGQKRMGLQGPLDDAFCGAFVCVLGSGETWHPSTQKFVDAKVKAFKYDWAKHWRGELPTTGDYAVTPNDIKDKNLILFGDPSSNLTLAQIMPKLPFKWTKDEIEFNGKKYKSSEHVPVLIFPNPLDPSKYVVLNTGHTFPSEDYNKTNAMLFPRLGDYAVLRMTPTAKNAAAYEVAAAGLFDEFWHFEK